MPRQPTFQPRPEKRGGKKTGRWRLYLPDPGKRVGKNKRSGWRDLYFSSFDEAKNFADEAKARHLAGRAGLATVDPAAALRFQQIEKRCARLGFSSPESLLDDVEQKHELRPGGPTLGELIDSFAIHKSKDWNSATHSTFRTCTRPFSRILNQRAGAITPTDWENFFNDLRATKSIATSTFNRSITFLRAIYEHAIHHQRLTTNPVRNIRLARADLERDPVIVTAAQIATFLSHAVLYHPSTVPYWALCFFAGARPASEAFRVRWSDVLWDRLNAGGRNGEIIIPKPTDRRDSSTKTKRSRYVEMEANLRAWLEPFRDFGQYLAPVSDRSDRPSRQIVRQSRELIAQGNYCARDESGQLVPLIVWGRDNRDLTRHTYATAFSKAHHNENGVNSRLKNNLGHGSETTADVFYKNPHMTNEQAKAIFSIFPTNSQRLALEKFVRK